MAKWDLAMRSRALLLLSKGQSARKVAKAVGVSNQTVYRHMKDPEFAADLADLQRQVVQRATRILNGGASDAAKLMVRAIRDGDVSTQQIRAAEITMKLCGMKPPERLEISSGASMSDEQLAEAMAAEAAKMAGQEDETE